MHDVVHRDAGNGINRYMGAYGSGEGEWFQGFAANGDYYARVSREIQDVMGSRYSST